MVIIVVGVGTVRGWRSTWLGAAAGLAVLAVLVLALGTALTLVPIGALRLAVGSLLLVFGLQWLRKGIGRVSADGFRGMGARSASADGIPGHGVDWTAFVLSFKGVLLEGLEIALIVVSFGATAQAFPAAVLRGRRLRSHRRRGTARPRDRGADPAQRPAAPGGDAAVKLRDLLGRGGARGRVAGRRRRDPRPDRVVRARRCRVHRASAAACQQARSPEREVNHDPFLAQPRRDREPWLAPGIRKVLVPVRHRRRLDRRRDRSGRSPADLVAAHRGRGRVVAAAAGCGGLVGASLRRISR